MKDRRTLLRETLVGMFAVSGKHALPNVLSVVAAVLCLSWIADSLYPAVQGLAGLLSGFVGYWLPVPEPLISALLSISLFAGLLLWLMLRNRKLGSAPPVLNQVSPQPHSRLIILLPPLGARSRETPAGPVRATTEEIDAALARLGDHARYQEARNFLLLGSNWGPLLAAVEMHGDRLESCTVITTPDKVGSSKHFAEAARLIRLVAGRDVEVVEKPLRHAYDLMHATSVCGSAIDDLLNDASDREIIADITGGLSLMTAALALAARERGVALQYLKQAPLEENGIAFSVEAMRERSLLVEVRYEHVSKVEQAA